jgi:LPXTG-motif cell wall-anchored protein
MILWLALVGSMVGVSVPASAQTSWNLVSLCTPFENFQASQRTFRVDNPTGQTTRVTLRNLSIGQQIEVDAPPGQSRWQVPAGPGVNTVVLTVPGGPTVTKASNNRVCAVVSGTAVCDPTVGQTTVTWTVRNNDGSPKPITASTQPVTFAPNPIPSNGTSTGTQVITGPASDQTVTITVTVDLGADVISQPTASVFAAACVGPGPPQDVTFTFTKAASVDVANVGDTISYVYCGQNTSTIPLEVTRLVDDRLGIVIELPDVDTLIQPGGTICNTDLGEPRSYTVTELDAGTTIENAAVVTVRDPATDRVFQQVAEDAVVVPLPPLPPDPEPEPTTTTSSPPSPTTTTPAVAPPTPAPTLPATGPSTASTSAVVVAALLALGAAAMVLARRPRS